MRPDFWIDDPTKSSTYQDTIPNSLDTLTSDGNPDGNLVNILGGYFTDSFALGGAQLKNFQMGLANSSANDTIYYGSLGLGPTSDEAPIPGKTSYPSFMDQLVEQSLINTRSYSFYMNDLNSTTGSVVFGGIDTKKFSGTLGVQPSPNGLLDLAGMTYVDDHGVTTSLSSSTNLTANIFPSNILCWVPDSIVDKLISPLRASDDRNNSGLVFVDCGTRSTYAGAHFTFTFGLLNGGGPAINVPIGEMILPLSSFYDVASPYYTFKPPFADTCVLGMTGIEQNDLLSGQDSTLLLGNTFMRSAYTVIDLDNNQTALAQSVFGVTDSHIVELTTSMNGIPALSGVAASSTSTSTSPGGSNPGTGASGGKSGSISGGAIAGIVVGVLAVLAAIGILAFFCFRRRRALRQKPSHATEPPAETKTHEVPGKDNEVEKKEHHLVQGGVIDLTKDKLPKTDTREVVASDRAVDEDTLLAQDQRHEPPQATVGTGAADQPRELESQAQTNREELSGSGEHPVEAPSATYSPAYGEATDLPPEIEGQTQRSVQELLGSSQHPVEAPSATYSPAHDGIDSYGAISPGQFEVVGVPELAAEPSGRLSQSQPQNAVSPVSRSSISESVQSGPSNPEAGRAVSSDAGGASSGPSRLDILQQRMDRVRVEKERLSKLQELEEMEAALQKDIMAELKKEHGLDGR
jgi:Eukaryotic aspartyl protease